MQTILPDWLPAGLRRRLLILQAQRDGCEARLRLLRLRIEARLEQVEAEGVEGGGDDEDGGH